MCRCEGSRCQRWAAVTLAALAWVWPAAGQTAGPTHVHQAPPAAHGHAHPSLPPERARERQLQLEHGEAALGRRDAEAALRAFEAASQIAHSADAELGIVRAQMQAGRYRDALGFASHTAGAHLDEPGGAALYAWLLQLGGQADLSHRVMQGARQRAPQHPVVRASARALQSAFPQATTELLRPPARMAPYADTAGLPGYMALVSNGTLVAGGTQVLVPASALRRGMVWVRTALGALRKATPVRVDKGLNVALLQLEAPLPVAATLRGAADVYPGSIAVTVQFAPSARALPAWPALHYGFVGQPDGMAKRLLNLKLPGGTTWRYGGPVYDKAGVCMGVLIGTATSQRLVTARSLAQAFGSQLFAQSAPTTPGALHGVGAPLDALYEQALRGDVVQVLQGMQ